MAIKHKGQPHKGSGKTKEEVRDEREQGAQQGPAASDPVDPRAEAQRQARIRREHQQTLAATSGQQLWDEEAGEEQPDPTLDSLGFLCLEWLEAQDARVGVEADVRDNKTGPGALKEAVKREAKAHARLHAVYLDFQAQGDDDELLKEDPEELTDSDAAADGKHSPVTRHDG